MVREASLGMRAVGLEVAGFPTIPAFVLRLTVAVVDNNFVVAIILVGMLSFAYHLCFVLPVLHLLCST